ncbi:hypothetical protein NFO65_13500 [Neorhizobium galegae]|uniref:hypothetical protein n=1 Tax=Neorhizobium galegae TaxID=399 RepID=UPI002100B49D|nr:hypothetical protein [Neorhizobium galegae]MCQ1571742.1 hypothetical protein [Neorhizobium galegae]
MTKQRDVGDLQQVALRPAASTPDTPYRPAPDMSGINSLIQGLSNISENVAQLGVTMARADKQKRDDPEAKRNAYARSSIAAAQAGDDPAAIGKLRDGASDEHEREGYDIALVEKLARDQDAEWNTLASQSGANNVDWQEQKRAFAQKSAGLITTDAGRARLAELMDNSVSRYTAAANTTTAQNIGQSRDIALRQETNLLTDTFSKKPEEAQAEMDELFNSAKFKALQPAERQQAIERIIDGVVSSGNAVAFESLGSLKGPDGVPIKQTYADKWTVAGKSVVDNARKMNPEAYAKAEKQVAEAGGDFLKLWKMRQGTPAGDIILKYTIDNATGAAAANDALGGLATEFATNPNLDVDQFKAKYLKNLKEQGTDLQGEQFTAFNSAFDGVAQSYKTAGRAAAGANAEAQLKGTLTKAVNAVFESNLPNGIDVATNAANAYLANMGAIHNLTTADKLKMFDAIVQGAITKGNTKALDALAGVEINGQKLSDWNLDKWALYKEQAASQDRQQKAIATEPAYLDALNKSDQGEFTDEDEKVLRAAGVTEDKIRTVRNNNIQSQNALRTAREKVLKDNFETQTKAELGSKAAEAINAGTAAGTIQPYKNAFMGKDVSVSAEDQFSAGVDILKGVYQRQFYADWQRDPSKRGAQPTEAARDQYVKQRVQQAYSNNGRMDPETEGIAKAFVLKSSRENYEVSQSDMEQLKSLRQLYEGGTYAQPLWDKAFGDEKGRKFFETLLYSMPGNDVQSAFAEARRVRDTPDHELPKLPREDLKVAVPEVRTLVNSAVTVPEPQKGVIFSNDTSTEEDAVVNELLADKFQYYYGITSGDAEAAKKKAAAWYTDNYIHMNGRAVQISQFAGGLKKGDRQVYVAKVLQNALDRYREHYKDKLGGDIMIDNVPGKPGQLMFIDKDFKTPVTPVTVSWDELVKDYDGTSKRAETKAMKDAQDRGEIKKKLDEMPAVIDLLPK